MQSRRDTNSGPNLLHTLCHFVVVASHFAPCMCRTRSASETVSILSQIRTVPMGRFAFTTLFVSAIVSLSSLVFLVVDQEHSQCLLGSGAADECIANLTSVGHTSLPPWIRAQPSKGRPCINLTEMVQVYTYALLICIPHEIYHTSSPRSQSVGRQWRTCMAYRCRLFDSRSLQTAEQQIRKDVNHQYQTALQSNLEGWTVW